MKYASALLFMLLSILTLSHTLSGQDLSKYYTSRVQEGGDLYYVMPFDKFRNASDKSEFVFDMLYRQGHDSVTINYTFYSSDAVKPFSIAFYSGDSTYSSETEKIFIDYKKNKWQNRYSLKLPFSQLDAMINSNAIPEIHILTDNGDMVYIIKEKNWETWSDIISKILFIIQSD
jgi:hypothetical protein